MSFLFEDDYPKSTFQRVSSLPGAEALAIVFFQKIELVPDDAFRRWKSKAWIVFQIFLIRVSLPFPEGTLSNRMKIFSDL